ncbi:protein-disulfide reductase DsbD domain-containing protein [Antarcticirhabdus aurantiaca]|uniref:Protein-disulfide reductase DsbD family protein n=1 Tax=Antarcticirhabdus aurantiaca TaxID=2606717 RepID=A0ACD4NK20_9HYPH|nr:protein-disulfide reductase DsbD domain-containing protein [Antarcticirhabdus aurantiaca]WAJ27187.1 protein-disulfide reductase DsbD family protein [Jeongeuplla avenae]
MRFVILALAAVAGLASAPARANENAVFRNEAVRLEWVLDARNGAEGPLRGALLVDLEPGWTTYWRDPGEAGLAPILHFSSDAGAALAASWSQPAPRRIPEGALSVNAYEGRTAFAVTLPDAPAEGGHVAVDLLIGVCREICVPVSARLEASVEAEPSLADKRAVRAAFAGLPAPAAPGRIALLPPAEGEAGRLLRVAVGAEDGGADLFVSAAPGWRFGPPRREAEGDEAGRALFLVPITARPGGTSPEAMPDGVDIVLSSGDKAVTASSLSIR